MSIISKYKLKADEWFHYGQWEQPPLSASFWVYWHNRDIVEKIGIKNLDGRIIMVNGHTIVYKKDLEILRTYLKKACEDNDEFFFKRLNRISLRILKEHLGLVSSLGGCKEISIELFDRFIASSKRVTVLWWINVPFSDYIGEILVDKADGLGISATGVVRSIPSREALMIKQHYGALKIKRILEEKGLLEKLKDSIESILVGLKKDKALLQRIQNHVKEYEWVGTHHFWGEPLSVEKFLKSLVNLKETDQKKKIKDLPRELEFLARVAGDIGFLRQYSAEIFDLVAFKARGFLEEIAKKLKLNYEELLLLTPTEISIYLKKRIQPIKNNLAKRNKGFCVLIKSGKEIVVDGPREVAGFIKELVPQRDLSAKQLKGVVASEGYAKGIVKVFLVPEELTKMKQGDILVTTMTTPDFVPLMQRAAAIITDIGGLLSHAAIISREMKKPCIIGTDVSTKVLRDGDLVEVDANKGVVKILKRVKR